MHQNLIQKHLSDVESTIFPTREQLNHPMGDIYVNLVVIFPEAARDFSCRIVQLSDMFFIRCTEYKRVKMVLSKPYAR